MTEQELEKDLRAIVGERVTTSPFERWFYTSDLVPVPNWVKNLFQTMPMAVVKVQTTPEVSALLSYCSRHQVPAIPRGGGSSGLFAAVPKKGGIVLDLMELSRVLHIDREKELVTAEAGITWWELDRRLRSEGLAVRSYPSSARSATVGGWLMGSGLGIGSLKYASVSEQLLAAEVVLADGTVKEYAPGHGLEWFSGSEGMLGVVTKVSLRVRPLPPSTSHHLLYFVEIKDLFEFVRHLVETVPCPYALEFFDANYLSLLKAAGYAVNDFVPGSGMLLVTYEGDRAEIEAGSEVTRKLLPQYHGEEKGGAEEEWRQRFNMLRVRRAAPTVIPSSVHVPLKNLNKFYAGMRKLRKRPIGLLGHIVSADEGLLMPLVVSNERERVEYNLALHTPRELSNLALSQGGKPGGGLGVWNAPYRKAILSSSQVREFKKRRQELNPSGVLNPGMWLEPPLLFRPAFYQMAMTVAAALDRVLPARAGESKVPDLESEFSACVQCGYCMNYCPTRQKWLSSTPRGRILMAKSLFSPYLWDIKEITQDYLNSVFQCTLCGRCKVDCSVDIKSPQMWIDLRNHLVAQGFELESLKALTSNIERTHNVLSRPNEQRANWTKGLKLPYELGEKKKAKVVYYVGCVTSFYPMVHDIARSLAQILDAAGVDFTVLGGEEWCCGFPLLSAGHKEAAIKTMEHNIERIKEIGAESVVMNCTGCYRMWKEEYHHASGRDIPFAVLHSTEFIADLIEQGGIKFGELKDKITYHDPCDLGRNSAIYDEPRFILNQIPGMEFVELRDNREYCNCCGSGDDLLVSNQSLSLEIAKRKVSEILDTGAKTAVTACPSCVMAITMAKTAEKAPFNVLDITQLVAKAMIREETEKVIPAKKPEEVAKAAPTRKPEGIPLVVYQLGLTDYRKAYDLQRELHRQVSDSVRADALLLLEHPPTITIGKSGKLENVLASKGQLTQEGITLLFVDRGGDVTYHCSGQLVAYPIIDLRKREKDVHQYVHELEEVVIRTLSDFGIRGERDASHAGVWVNGEEIAAIGISLKNWVTMHGVALNVNPDLSRFSLINVCGLPGRKATSISHFLSREVAMEAVTERLLARFAEVFGAHLELSSDIPLRNG